MRERINITIDAPEPEPALAPEEQHDREERTAEEKEFLRDAGRALVTHLFAACKTVRLYDMNNRAAQRQLGEVDASLRPIFEKEGEATIRVSGDFIHLNDYRIPLDSQHYGPFEFVAEEMRKRDVESITFRPGTSSVEIGSFLNVLLELDPVEAAYNNLQKGLAIESVEYIVTSRLEEQEQELREVDSKSDLQMRSNRVYFRTVALMGDILRTIEEKHMLQIRKAKRLTQQMVDIIQTDESMFVGLASIKNFDSYTFMHSVNVCILSMMMGDRLHLDRSDVARLGVSALFHDIGKTYIPSSILNSKGQLTPREWELMKYHTFFGVKELSRIRTLRETADSLFVALQHHVHTNDNGYPQRPGGWNLRLFSRIVTIADYYDAMTASRSYQKVPITPDKALRFILDKSGEIFDPFIAKVFIQAMGLYPVGTIVELTTGEKAIVIRQNADSKYIHRPQVELVDPTADATTGHDVVDLTECASGEFDFKRSVTRTIHDTEIDVDKRQFFIHS